MKPGTENRSKLILAVVLMALAVVLVGRFLYSTFSAPSAAAAPSAGAAENRVALEGSDAPAARNPAGARKTSVTSKNSLDPSLRFDFLRASEDTKYEGRGRNIFRAQAEIPQIVKSPVIETPQNTGPPPPPPPPPINLKFFGFASKPGEPKRIFLSENGDVFIAKEGDIVDRQYRVVRISPMAVEIEDVLHNNRQQIPLTQG
ncbi:MAG TPA: hypothetical protein VGF06_17175 [Terriglobales bacterium]